MIIELHVIQSFAPANLNRDDTGAPKEAVFGGVRRARVSSQAWKRAIRAAFRAEGDLEVATRTKRAHEVVVKRILAGAEVSEDAAHHRAAVLLEAEPLKLKLKREREDSDVKTGQLLFFRDADFDVLSRLGVEHGETLDAMTSTLTGGKADKLPKELAAIVRTAMTDPGSAIDVALFGRMVAELPEGNVDAACQVAHAIGTHRLSAEFDYYTAVDDLKPEDTEGADMIGTIAFNASCFYRYAVLDTDQLARNLGPGADRDHLVSVVSRFTRTFITVAPTGKQSSFAARNLPTAVLAVTRSSGAMNLSNAFIVPDRREANGLAAASTKAMLDEFTALERMFGARDESTTATLLSAGEHVGDWTEVEHLDHLIARVTESV